MTDTMDTAPVPVILTNVKLGIVMTDGGPLIMIFPQVIVEGSFAQDRAHALTLGAELMKMAKSLPSDKDIEKARKRQKNIEVPHPEGEQVLESGLVLPGA